jgi:uncharacterized metal-binding protein YceD (DUF177 family)
MEIFLNEIPEEGLLRSGELPASIFDLSESDSIRPTGPVRYEVEMHRFDDVVTFHGRLIGDFQLQCATCLEFVDYHADFSEWNSDLDLEEGQQSFDLAQVIREDFLLDLPASPRCDEIIEGRVCPKAKTVEEALHDPDGEPPSSEGSADAWSALDDLK